MKYTTSSCLSGYVNRKFHDVEEVKSAIAAHCPEGRYILIKGSNSTKLYQLPDLL